MTDVLSFGDVKRSTTAARVADQIRQAVLRGEFKPGERLPAEQRLAASFGVSRVVVREALKALQGAGLIDYGRPGREGGPVVLGIPEGKAVEVLGDHLRLQEVPIPALVEFRVLVESGAARWAAERRSASGLERLHATVERMERPRLSWDEYHELDIAFHLAVIEASENPIAAVVMRAIREAMGRAMIDGFRRAPRPAELRATMVAQHREIYETIAAGNAADAEAMVRRHILDFYERLFPSELGAGR